jgi:large subunit ribosomal protein L30
LAEKTKDRKCIAAIRIRGTVSASMQARETLQMLRLARNNYAVLVDDRPSFLGMIRTVQDYVTYGEVSNEAVTALIKEKARLAGNKELTDEYAKKLGYGSLEELADAIHSCQVEYWKLPSIQPFFRLHPPTKGFKGKIKKSYASGGELGYRRDKINELLERMF